MMTTSKDHPGTFLITDQKWRYFTVHKKGSSSGKFYRGGIVPQSCSSGPSHMRGGTIRPIFLMTYVCHCMSLIIQMISSLLFRSTVDRWIFEMLLFFSSLSRFYAPKYWCYFIALHFSGLHGLDKTSQHATLCKNCQSHVGKTPMSVRVVMISIDHTLKL